MCRRYEFGFYEFGFCGSMTKGRSTNRASEDDDFLDLSRGFVLEERFSNEGTDVPSSSDGKCGECRHVVYQKRGGLCGREE